MQGHTGMLRVITAIGGVGIAVCAFRMYASNSITTAASNVVVVTDIGKDIDDTIALLFLMELHKKNIINLKAVITCGGRTSDRAKVASILLRHVLGTNNIIIIHGSDVRVDDSAFLNSDVLTHPISDDINISNETHQIDCVLNDSHVVCLGPVTDIASNITLKNKPKSLLIQGQATKSLQPDPESYNLRCDIEAAELLFKRGRELNIPIVLLGKYAAYECPIKQEHIEYIKLCRSELPWDLRSVVLETLQEFVKDESSPEILKRAYGVDVRELHKLSSIPMGTRIWNTFPHLSVPYDPLCCMLLGLVEPTNKVLRAFSNNFSTNQISENITTVGNGPKDFAVKNPNLVIHLLLRTASGDNWEEEISKHY